MYTMQYMYGLIKHKENVLCVYLYFFVSIQISCNKHMCYFSSDLVD